MSEAPRQFELGLEDLLCARHRLDAREAALVRVHVAGEAQGLPLHEQARAAGFGGPNATANSLTVAARKVLKRPAVQLAVAEFRREAAKGAQIEHAEVYRGLRLLLDQALGSARVRKTLTGLRRVGDGDEVVADAVDVEVFDPNPTAARGALELMGKALGLWTDKLEHGGEVVVRRWFDGSSATEEDGGSGE